MLALSPTPASRQMPQVGAGFRVVDAGALVEKGDQYEAQPGVFESFPLEAVGRPVEAGILVRRIQAVTALF